MNDIEKDEEWRDIPDWEGFYQISSFGRVRSLTRIHYTVIKGTLCIRKRQSQIIKSRLLAGNRPGVVLSKNSVKKDYIVAALLAYAFIGPRPLGMQICHRNGVSTHNFPDNIYYGTPKQNAEDCTKHGTRFYPKGSKNGTHVLLEEDIPKIRALIGFSTLREIGEIFNVSPQTICDIRKGRLWSHL